jgi:hypothetical protein
MTKFFTSFFAAAITAAVLATSFFTGGFGVKAEEIGDAPEMEYHETTPTTPEEYYDNIQIGDLVLMDEEEREILRTSAGRTYFLHFVDENEEEYEVVQVLHTEVLGGSGGDVIVYIPNPEIPYGTRFMGWNANMDGTDIYITPIFLEDVEDVDVILDSCVDVLRYYNPESGQHMFTTSLEERNMLLSAGWNYEGVAFRTTVYPENPVYRLYDAKDGAHLFTSSDFERDQLVEMGWEYEGVAWYSSVGPDATAVFRAYNPNNGDHFFTASAAEAVSLETIGWVYEGLAFYVK